MNGKAEPGYHLKPRFLFLVTLGAVFLAELLVMVLLRFLPELPLMGEALLDACLLSLFVVPFFYFFFLLPLHGNIRRRLQTETERNRYREIDSLKSEFISTAAHELRTPLASIMGYSEVLLLQEDLDRERRREFAAVIHQKAEAMERLVDDLLDLGRLELRQPLRVRKEPADVVALVAAVVEEYRQKDPRRSFTARLPEGPVILPFDKVRIEQVFDNLLNNAIRFSPAGSPVEVEASLRNGDFLVRIRDRGIGMTPETLERIFDKFYRGDTSDTSPGGLGLGMTIVRELVTLHGGRVWLESAPGKGTVACFTLPVRS